MFWPLIVGLIDLIVGSYSLITLPIYYYLQNPSERIKRANVTRAIKSDPKSYWLRAGPAAVNYHDDCLTVDDVFRKSVQAYGDRNCFGHREILIRNNNFIDGEKNGFKQLGDYKWMTYRDVDRKVDLLVRGLVSIGVKPKDKVLIFAETRFEWMLMLLAIFRLKASVATLYPSLGDQGLIYGLKELDVSVAVTSSEYLPKLIQLHLEVPKLRTIINFDDTAAHVLNTIRKDSIRVEIIPLSSLEVRQCEVTFSLNDRQLSTKDLALIVYTSGSTGIPKGVMLSHQNILELMKNMAFKRDYLRPTDIYAAFMPLSHFAEVGFELVMLSLGVPIGFATMNSLTDHSAAKHFPGMKGDLTLLEPSFTFTVPLVLERFTSLAYEELEKYWIPKELILWAVRYKKTWRKKGFKTPILDKLIAEKVSNLLGGKLKYLISGGASLSEETEDFIRYAFGINILQGYGSTEVSCVATLMDPNDLDTGFVGYPVLGVKLRLVDWAEGGYLSTDSPNPRGEVVIGGEGVTLGYFKREKVTREVFIEEEDGVWFYSGDIGEMSPTGALKIIDRKKDLVKLKNGKYIALGKIEATLKSCQFLDNICIHADDVKDYVIALVVPKREAMQRMADKLSKANENVSFEDLCRDSNVVSWFTQSIESFGKEHGLQKREIPRKVILCSDQWTPESGLLTAAFKLLRHSIYKKYNREIISAYL